MREDPTGTIEGRVTDTPSATTLRRYLDIESSRFLQVIAECDPTTPVPACPDWDAADLLWHLARVQWFWSEIVARRPLGPEPLVEPQRPQSFPNLLRSFEKYAAALWAAFEGTNPSEPCWTWSTDNTVAFAVRRQAHEAHIHRLDAEQAAGVASMHVDPEFAADGVHEALSVALARRWRNASTTSLGAHVQLHLLDTGDRFWLRLDTLSEHAAERPSDHDVAVLVTPPSSSAEAVLRGSAADIDAWVWGRRQAHQLEVTGDRVLVDRMRASLH